MSLEARSTRFIKKLSMAVAKKDWARIKKSHNPIGEKYIDHAQHLSKYPAPEEYKNLLASTEESKSRHKDVSGIRRKMIHDVPMGENNNTIMTKAYHSAPERDTRTWVKYPITGWATMTTKALFDAADLGHASEDVSTHEVDGMPVTVHKFGKDFETVQDAISKTSHGRMMRQTADPDAVYRIAAMDFLTGNGDRHKLNMLVGSTENVNERGYNPVMAIDHERNFQYAKPAKWLRNERFHGSSASSAGTVDKPVDYLNFTALKPLAATTGDNDSVGFREWWLEVAPKIEAAFNDNLTLIKEPSLKDHIRRNFMQRMTLINQWATENTEGNFEKMDLFDKDLPKVVRLIPKPRAAPETIEKVLASLPVNDPMKAIEIIAATSGKKRAYGTQEKLKDAFFTLLGKLTTPQLIELYDKYRKNLSLTIDGQGISYQLAMWVINSYKIDVAKALLEYDNGTGKLYPFWVKELKMISNGGTDETALQVATEQ